MYLATNNLTVVLLAPITAVLLSTNGQLVDSLVLNVLIKLLIMEVFFLMEICIGENVYKKIQLMFLVLLT